MSNKKRIIPITLCAAGATAFVLTQTAGSTRQYQLGGSWVGHSADGNIWNAIHAPLDPAGHRDAARVTFPKYNATIAGLLAAFGADSMSDFTGEGVLISNDTAKWTLVGYALAQGNPPVSKGILIGRGTWKYVSADNALLNYTMYIYTRLKMMQTVTDIQMKAQRLPSR